ncbi:hypothetical protein [Marinibacterium sp. SX1]|uniref:hypothetical protein n=1 Tax=Marinibacterium sp. SX1 TaxID=3388424 RepID=UPI003D165ABE
MSPVTQQRPGAIRAALAWALVAGLMVGPVVVAAFSPYLAWRSAAYVIGGFAGILCLSLMLIQPLLAAGYMPGLAPALARRWHRRIGTGLVALVAVHVGGLFLTSPMDTLDVLLLRAPTPFAVHGFLAMWGIVLTALLVALRRRLARRTILSDTAWRWLHNLLALGVVATTCIHAARIDGAMGPVSKAVLLVAVALAGGLAALDLRLLRPARHRRKPPDSGHLGP